MDTHTLAGVIFSFLAVTAGNDRIRRLLAVQRGDAPTVTPVADVVTLALVVHRRHCPRTPVDPDVADAVRAVDPQAFEGTPLLKPVTMSLFGMLNWFYMWFRDGGAISREDYAHMATTLILEGVKAVK